MIAMDGKEDHEHEGPVPFSCRHCRHYYVTWDKAFPHGCRAMGFKGKTSPSVSVRQASGMDCQLFVKREQKE
jgi:hypothetical protein